jgi:hypothetical protein
MSRISIDTCDRDEFGGESVIGGKCSVDDRYRHRPGEGDRASALELGREHNACHDCRNASPICYCYLRIESRSNRYFCTSERRGTSRVGRKINFGYSHISRFVVLRRFEAGVNESPATTIFIPTGSWNKSRSSHSLRPLMLTLVGRPKIISHITLPVPRLREIPQGPCPAANQTPPSSAARVDIPPRSASWILDNRGVPNLVVGRKHRPRLTISKSPECSLVPRSA